MTIKKEKILKVLGDDAMTVEEVYNEIEDESLAEVFWTLQQMKDGDSIILNEDTDEYTVNHD